ncbi:hypothetical protein L204_104433 [Cryptococcus depauperatus]|nr:thyroid hormone receptor interactor 13 [Cryptococcus depauperatus CBS 7855]
MSPILEFNSAPPSSSSKSRIRGPSTVPFADPVRPKRCADSSKEARVVSKSEQDNMLVDTDEELEYDESDDEHDRMVVHVEVRQKQHSRLREQPIMQIVIQYIDEDLAKIELGRELPGWTDVDILRDHVERVMVEEGAIGLASVQVSEVDIHVHVYKTSLDNQVEEFSADLDDDNENEEKVSAASVRSLPSADLDGIWDTLVYSDDIKARLLDYIYSTILFSECDIDFNVIAWNRVILLHGPPGTGKTSLCRALAQKISIRLSQKYRHGKIIEINSHSLFSKWFSESGKLVQKLFQMVTDMVEDESGFVVVMIDEVESLTAARAGAMKGNEPSDSLRVVNALLTQLDKLRTRKNVLVMTTSNLVDAIDEAFISRVDLQEHIPLPPPRAVYSILSGCLQECITKGLIRHCRILDWKAAEEAQNERKWGRTDSIEGMKQGKRERAVSGVLADLAVKCHSLELSGRTLRKLPVVSHARYLSRSSGEHRPLRVERWVEAMERVVDIEAQKKIESLKLIEGEVHDTMEKQLGVGGHRKTISKERHELGTMVGTKMKGGGHGHNHHHGV